jgi:hypothetical protein
MIKIQSMNSFDKGFFGSTLTSFYNKVVPKLEKPSKIEFSSVDDFNKYFSDKVSQHAKELSKTESVDSFSRNVDTSEDFWQGLCKGPKI